LTREQLILNLNETERGKYDIHCVILGIYSFIFESQNDVYCFRCKALE